MAIRSLAAVGVRLEEAVAALPGEAATPADQYDRYEGLAIAMLDSEFEDYRDGMLEEYLMTFLYLKQLELGILPECEE